MINFLKKIFNIETPDFAAIAKGGATIIDVRTKAEYRSGSIKGAKNIPLNTLDGKVNQFKKSNKPVIAYCRSGSRSRMAVARLKASGVEAYNGGSIFQLQSALKN